MSMKEGGNIVSKELGIINSILSQLAQIFSIFKERCKHRDNTACMHKDFHKDFALANICSLKDCPIVLRHGTDSHLIDADNIVIYYECCECKCVENMPLKDHLGMASLCGECTELENFMEIIGITIE